MSFNALQNISTIQPKKGHQKDKYKGQIHNQTKKRHGKGNFIYANNFFQFQGQYNQGKKQGKGKLKLKDGTVIQANFVNDQIQGQGKIKYPNGAIYTGQFLLGQKNGTGFYQSQYQKYQGEYKQNRKEGRGIYQVLTTKLKYQGQFKNDKFHGNGSLIAYNYSYQGQFIEGNKEGKGKEKNDWRRVESEINQLVNQKLYKKQKQYDRYQYEGNFSNDKFHGQGTYLSTCSKYQYLGQFIQGLPLNYPNQFRVYHSTLTKNQIGQFIQSDKILIDQNSNTIVQYQLEKDIKIFYVQCVFQGEQYLDQNQPTEQEIQKMIENWQNENKKNKNPPPMPDFRAPKMKKPELLLIQEQTGRKITFCLQKQLNQKQSQKMKIDYRNEIKLKRQENQKILEQLKKSQEQDPKKKGGKKDPKGQTELKINLFKEKCNLKQQKLNIETQKGICCFKGFQLPDDFPPGKYYLTIHSQFMDFGVIKSRKIELNIKSKQAAGKKK